MGLGKTELALIGHFLGRIVIGIAVIIDNAAFQPLRGTNLDHAIFSAPGKAAGRGNNAA